MEPCTGFGEPAEVVGRFEQSLYRDDGTVGGGGGEHDGVADRLDQLGAGALDGGGCDAGEHVDQIDGREIAVGLGESREPGEVHEGDRAIGAHRGLARRTLCRA